MRKLKLLLLIITLGILSPSTAQGKINPLIIVEIESGGNLNAYNKRTQAIGLFQITPVCLTHYNNVHRSSFNLSRLFDPDFNRIVGEWYLSWLAAHTESDNEVLIAYNWGIGNLRKWNGSFQSLPFETKKYIRKYHILEKKANGKTTGIPE